MLQFPEGYFKREIRSNTVVSETTKRVWACQLEILQKIDVICKKYDITYYAYWGSLLGAIRHKGFVPWDDDFDIAMLKDDYIKFLSVAQEELPEDYWLLNMYTTEKWDNVFSRVANGKSIDLKKSRNSEYHGCPLALGIDIFPLYYVPRDKNVAENQKILLRVIEELRGIVEYRYNDKIATEEEKSQYDIVIAQNLVDIQRITGYEFTTDRPLKNQLNIVFDQMCRLAEAEDADCVASFVHYIEKNKHVIDKRLYKPIEMPFENIMVTVPKGYDTILRQMYGDYMFEWKSNSLERHNAIRLQTEELGELLEAHYLQELNLGESVKISVKRKEDLGPEGVPYEQAKELLPEDWLKKIYYQDDLGAWKRKKVFFYYTGINAMLINSECVVEKITEVLERFKNHPEVVLWWMPCRLDGEKLEILHDYAPDMKAGYEAVMQKYQQEDWGIYDVSGDVSRAIDMSDAYYGDKGLLVRVYKATGKKIMYQHYHVENLMDIISSEQ